MRRVIRYVCGQCDYLYFSPEAAEQCELDDKERKKQQDAAEAEEKRWQNQGHDVWHEYPGTMKHAPAVDGKLFGSHDYGNHDGTSDCAFKCGCWMGPARSGGPVNPFGPCPNNPIAKQKEMA